ncbi:phenylalanine--tRNA ligase alpha subunit, putative [Plasmodium gallinaceum]|uniref:phenylalanine--tRNA ligase n=1 Tax=Plasmodium gallinaceum TaxID=5849 RepID=A0A1J1GPY5_PLAGA|nr:phenylalanine--tRNA ligase alpha subunit, putative [Plasmodium gallinaceum]CRG93351.1 phenylalanine--tRNA ligase alpha subunit, putative [Plasmodium gallinaceum]
MNNNISEEKKNEELCNFLHILDEEFKLCKEKESNEKKEHCEYYSNLKKDKGIDVLLNEYTTSLHISKKYKIDHNKAIGMIKKLETLYYIINNIKNFNTYLLTEEGTQYLREGSPEYVVLRFVLEKKKCAMEDLKKIFGKRGDIGLNINLKNKMIELNKNEKSLSSSMDINKIEDKTQIYLEIINRYGNDEDILFDELKKKNIENINNLIQDLKKRKLLEVKKNSYSYIIKTSNFRKDIKKQITDLTYSLLKNEEYQKYDIKKYNFFSSGKKINKGNLHLLTKQMRTFKEIFISLGFEEMETNKYVESSFWCFDALYIPQQHPSRDLQDTFFIKEPETCQNNFIDSEYIENIRRVHTHGDYGSFGWNYNWRLDESKKNVLRTHTTANSCRVLFNLAKEYKKKGRIIPKKYFSIDKVFRNENLDSTHLAEFHQIEGLIIDKDLGLGHLIGTLSAFYKNIGIHKLKFKPTFNPYTEPSMEIYGYHEQNKKWLEVGNSGIFRPEMLRSMGFSKEVSVIAWGLSLERPTMIKYNIKNIRDLFGYKSVI